MTLVLERARQTLSCLRANPLGDVRDVQCVLPRAIRLALVDREVAKFVRWRRVRINYAVTDDDDDRVPLGLDRFGV